MSSPSPSSSRTFKSAPLASLPVSQSPPTPESCHSLSTIPSCPSLMTPESCPSSVAQSSPNSPSSPSSSSPPSISSSSSSSCEPALVLPKPSHSSNASLRLALRTLVYLLYDRVSITDSYKQLARIVKALVELALDETIPPPRRTDMSLSRKCAEFLLPPTISTLIVHLVRLFRPSSRPSTSHLQALGAVLHRMMRQVLIYRLFFRIGTIEYTLASLLGIVCCFFRDTLFREIIFLNRWVRHFNAKQGAMAMWRSAIYMLAFSIPVGKLAHSLKECPRRRGNVKKILFALALAQNQRVSSIIQRVYAAHPKTM